MSLVSLNGAQVCFWILHLCDSEWGGAVRQRSDSHSMLKFWSDNHRRDVSHPTRQGLERLFRFGGYVIDGRDKASDLMLGQSHYFKTALEQ